MSSALRAAGRSAHANGSPMRSYSTLASGRDAVAMLGPGVKTSAIDLTQKKTGREITIAIHPELDRIIKATPADGVPARRRHRPQAHPLGRPALRRSSAIPKWPSRCGSIDRPWRS